MHTHSVENPCAPTQITTLLAERHAQLVAMLVRMRFARHDAEDAVQNAAVVCLRHARRGRTRPVTNPEAWLRVVVLRAAFRVARKRLNSDPVALEQLAAHAADDTDSQDEAAAVCRAVNRLPERLRGAIVLCTLEGLTRKVAAERLGVSVGEVGRRLAQARHELCPGLRVVMDGRSVVGSLAASRG